MTRTELNIGVLGAGQIAQSAHFESCTKAANARLYAICDLADDLRERMAHTHAPDKTFADYDDMLADPGLDAVIIATADAFHVPAAIRALRAGKHVLSEKPVGTSIEETAELARLVRDSGLTYMVGHMKRFDPGIQAAKAFIDGDMGQMVALKAWYCDSTRRYPMTDAVQPLIVTSARSRRPEGDPKTDKRRYYMLAHGSHLVDTARFLGGPITAVRARLSDQRGMFCWFVETEFANGVLGHLDLTVAVRMDWHEGFQIYGQNGSALGKTFNPWYFRSSEVDIFDERSGTSSRILGEDGHFYRRQVEGFARCILDGAPMTGASIEDGLASMRAMRAIALSVETGTRVELASVTGVM
ncbi:Gfo/Idh/MocA family protein [Paracoccus sp. (in: a-proteobacteria)]|uniref:Gfo/Idh/MocA family protein n=1 Tax=Paracoccus sp. TaxID=267 RepID=UPI003A8C0ED8